MSKDPAVLFYTSDFITGTITMTDEQRGKYILLLCVQHQKGRLTEKDMLNICKTYDKDIWDKFMKEGEFFYNKRMKEESERRLKYSESRRKNRVSKEIIEEEQENTSLSYVPHMETETINEDIIEEGEGKITKKKKLTYSEFYEIELSKTDDKDYHYFVKWLLGENETKEPFIKCLSLKHQIGFEQFKNYRLLAKKYGTKIMDKIMVLENNFNKYKPSSLSLTMAEWLKHDFENNGTEKTIKNL